MKPPRRLKPLSSEELRRLTKDRLPSYRKKALSLETSPEKSDHDADEIKKLDKTCLWFKSDSRWNPLYDEDLLALARLSSGSRRACAD
jgi:hypothetical protein